MPQKETPCRAKKKLLHPRSRKFSVDKKHLPLKETLEAEPNMCSDNMKLLSLLGMKSALQIPAEAAKLEALAFFQRHFLRSTNRNKLNPEDIHHIIDAIEPSFAETLTLKISAAALRSQPRTAETASAPTLTTSELTEQLTAAHSDPNNRTAAAGSRAARALLHLDHQSRVDIYNKMQNSDPSFCHWILEALCTEAIRLCSPDELAQFELEMLALPFLVDIMWWEIYGRAVCDSLSDSFEIMTAVTRASVNIHPVQLLQWVSAMLSTKCVHPGINTRCVGMVLIDKPILACLCFSSMKLADITTAEQLADLVFPVIHNVLKLDNLDAFCMKRVLRVIRHLRRQLPDSYTKLMDKYRENLIPAVLSQCHIQPNVAKKLIQRFSVSGTKALRAVCVSRIASTLKAIFANLSTWTAEQLATFASCWCHCIADMGDKHVISLEETSHLIELAACPALSSCAIAVLGLGGSMWMVSKTSRSKLLDTIVRLPELRLTSEARSTVVKVIARLGAERGELIQQLRQNISSLSIEALFILIVCLSNEPHAATQITRVASEIFDAPSTRVSRLDFLTTLVEAIEKVDFDKSYTELASTTLFLLMRHVAALPLPQQLAILPSIDSIAQLSHYFSDRAAVALLTECSTLQQSPELQFLASYTAAKFVSGIAPSPAQEHELVVGVLGCARDYMRTLENMSAYAPDDATLSLLLRQYSHLMSALSFDASAHVQFGLSTFLNVALSASNCSPLALELAAANVDYCKTTDASRVACELKNNQSGLWNNMQSLSMAASLVVSAPPCADSEEVLGLIFTRLLGVELHEDVIPLLMALTSLANQAAWDPLLYSGWFESIVAIICRPISEPGVLDALSHVLIGLANGASYSPAILVAISARWGALMEKLTACLKRQTAPGGDKFVLNSILLALSVVLFSTKDAPNFDTSGSNHHIRQIFLTDATDEIDASEAQETHDLVHDALATESGDDELTISQICSLLSSFFKPPGEEDT